MFLRVLYFACVLLNGSRAFSTDLNVTQKLTDLKPMNYTDSLFTKGATPELISNQFSFTEGPAVDRAGNVYFTDQPNNKIWKYGIDGTLTLFMENAGRSNGMYFDRKGNLLTCADEENQLWRISPDKKISILVKDYKGVHLNGPNDVWVHPDGHIYFTDPLYDRPYWKSKPVRVEKENVYLLPGGKQKPVIVDEALEKPNGIIGTPDGKYLYVADIKADKTYRYEIKRDGTLHNRQLFVAQGSDGMTVDNHGNVYLTGNGVTVYDKSGNKLVHIPIPGKWTANVCFGGKDKNKLFITASDAVYTLEMLVKGAQ